MGREWIWRDKWKITGTVYIYYISTLTLSCITRVKTRDPNTGDV